MPTALKTKADGAKYVTSRLGKLTSPCKKKAIDASAKICSNQTGISRGLCMDANFSRQLAIHCKGTAFYNRYLDEAVDSLCARAIGPCKNTTRNEIVAIMEGRHVSTTAAAKIVPNPSYQEPSSTSVDPNAAAAPVEEVAYRTIPSSADQVFQSNMTTNDQKETSETPAFLGVAWYWWAAGAGAVLLLRR